MTLEFVRFQQIFFYRANSYPFISHKKYFELDFKKTQTMNYPIPNIFVSSLLSEKKNEKNEVFFFISNEKK